MRAQFVKIIWKRKKKRKKSETAVKHLSLLFFPERQMWTLYLSLGQGKRGSHSCPPSLPPLYSSTPAWWCSGTERYRRSLHRLGCNNTLSSPLAKDRVEARGWEYWRYYCLQMIKEPFYFGQVWPFTFRGQREIEQGDIHAAPHPCRWCSAITASAEPAHLSEGMSSGISPLICWLNQMETLACESTHHSLSHD